MDTRLYWIWLQQALGIGNIKASSIIREFGGAKQIYDTKHDVDRLASIGLTQEKVNNLKNKSMKKSKDILRKTLNSGAWILTPDDAIYPPLLRATMDLPLVIYGMGTMPDLNVLPSFSIVGTRKISDYGYQATAWIAAGLAMGGAVVVSGGALGGDTVAHKMTLKAGGTTIAVQCCGLDINYPSKNSKLREEIIDNGGAIITEFTPGIQSRRHFFEIRNRIISGMTLGTCVTEAPLRSGTMITARHARDQGRDVYAVAGDMITGRSAGTDKLINDGAKLVTDAVGILEDYKSIYPDLIDIKLANKAKHDWRFNTGYGYAPDSPPTKFQKNKDEDNVIHLKIPTKATVQELKLAQYPVLVVDCPEYASENAKQIYDILEVNLTPIDDIIEKTGLSPPKALTALTELELYGCVKNNPGQMYSKEIKK